MSTDLMNTSTTVPFSFEGQPVRIIDRDGNPWFVLADVCRVLEIGNPTMAAARLDDDEKSTLNNTEGRAGNGAQSYTVVNESGLYSLVLTSRKPAAKRFKKWVTSEVIPSIRKTGGYGKTDIYKALHDPLTLRMLLAETNEKVLALEGTIEDMREDVDAHERLSKADGSLNITEAAKTLGVRPSDLFKWLSRNGWIYKRANGSTWLGYQEKCAQGLLEHKTTTVTRTDGSEKITEQVRITAKGPAVLAKALPRYVKDSPSIQSDQGGTLQ